MVRILGGTTMTESIRRLSEPVAWIEREPIDPNDPDITVDPVRAREYPDKCAPLYAHPPAPADPTPASYPTIEQAWDAAWKHAQKTFHARSMQDMEEQLAAAQAECEKLRDIVSDINDWHCGVGGGDRKSTRLNSSHVAIS